ncbi:hypothetical protein HDU98_007949, partial [Podochytrium sp. JEL0797]
MTSQCCFTSTTSSASQWNTWLNITVTSSLPSFDLLISPPDQYGFYSFASPTAISSTPKDAQNPAPCRPTHLRGNGSEWICDTTSPATTIAFQIDTSNA